MWDAIGYAGPLGHDRERAAEGDPGRSTWTATPTLDCDVCVVGSGAGGGTAAGVLAAAGLDVVVLEAGDYYDDADFDGGEFEGYGRMYMYGGGAATHDQSVGLLAGSCLGGGTTVNYTTSFRTPDDVREEWASHGVPGIRDRRVRRAASTRSASASASTRSTTRPSAREQVLHRGLTELGWHVDSMPRNVRGCDQGENCGYCGYGCRLGAKQSTVKTWLADAHAAGTPDPRRARSAERVLVDGGAARGVQARTADGPPRHGPRARGRRRLRRDPDAGAAAPLRASTNPNIGRHLRLHPATGRLGRLRRGGAPLGGHDAGDLLRRAPLHRRRLRRQVRDRRDPPEPAGHVLARGAAAREHARIMEALPHSVPIGVLLRDRDGGEVKVGRDGQPVVKYRLSDYDVGARAQGHRRRRADPRGGRRAADLLLALALGRLRARAATAAASSSCATPTRAAGTPAAAPTARSTSWARRRMGGSPHDVGLQPARRDLGRARPLRLRRLGVPDRVGRQPDDLDRVDRAHERVGARVVTALTHDARDSSIVC